MGGMRSLGRIGGGRRRAEAWTSVWLAGLLGLLGLVAACGGEEAAEPAADVEPHFEATVDGAVRYAMAGRAYYVLDERGRLAGLELDREDVGAGGGLSFEFVAGEPGDTVYAVAEGASASGGGRPAMMAYLDDGGHRFTAERGTLRLEPTPERWLSGGPLRGTFELQMGGYLDEQSGDDVEVVVTGAFVAVREGAR